MAGYVKLDALVAEIEKIYGQYKKQVNFEYMSTADFMCIELKKFLSLIKNLEVKEVDLEKDYKHKLMQKCVHKAYKKAMMLV